MKDKILSSDSYIYSIKRIEYLLEEMIFQQIVARIDNDDVANDKFNVVMKRVDTSVQDYFQNLPDAPDEEESQ